MLKATRIRIYPTTEQASFLNRQFGVVRFVYNTRASHSVSPLQVVSKAHERVANARNDFQHKVSRQIVDDSQAVIVETLKIRNMMKSARLAAHIGGASWHALIAMLDYKASSKECHQCQHKMDAMPLDIRSRDCPACHMHHDRDLNAALNIKQQGILKLKADGLSVSALQGSRKSDMSPVAAQEE